jgi:predicted AlkP superfamily phosphohydrolase/phosphomutase
MTRPVQLIGLDAAEPRLIEQWTDDGSLPTLRTLRREGAYARLRSTADWLVGSTWPTFYTGRLPAETGTTRSSGCRSACVTSGRRARTCRCCPSGGS